MYRQICLGLALAIAAMTAPAGAQTAPALYLDLATEGQIRSELFACLRRKLTASNVTLVEENGGARTHTAGVRAMTTRTTGGISGYVASVIVMRTLTPELQSRLVTSLPAEERARMLSDLAPYGTVVLSRLMVMPRGVQKMCDSISNEIETGLFDTSGRAKEQSKQ